MRPFDETRAAIMGNEHAILASLGIVLSGKRHIRCPLPHHEDRNPSWRFDFEKSHYFCSCSSGDLFDLWQGVGRAHSPGEAMADIRQLLGLPAAGPSSPETPQQRAERLRLQAALQAKAERQALVRSAEEKARYETQLRKAKYLYSSRKPASGTIVETYLRSRGLTCPVPDTLGFLPPSRPDRHPAMIAPFALAHEPEPGRAIVDVDRLGGVHLTLLQPDGSGKAKTAEGNSKLIIGLNHTMPIVLAPPNDGMALVIAEGIENALSVHQEMGFGAWAAGSAGRLPGLASRVPGSIESVTLAAEGDPAGWRGANQLAQRLSAREIEVKMMSVPNARCK
jgi:hypothetical protein